MRPGQHNKRGRGRNRRHNGGGGGGGGGGGNPLNRVYESNGPDVKVRGTAQTVADKYLQLGRDAQVSGDIVMAESYYQHAEHYLRILAAAQAYQQQMQQQFRRPEDEFGEDDEMDGQGEGDDGQPEIGNERPGFAQDAGDQPDGFDAGPERRDYQQGNRDNRDFQHNRGPDQQHNQGQGRDRNDRNNRGDRFRPRWENRRDNRDQQGGDNRYQQGGQQPYQARRDEQQPQPAAVEPEQPRLPVAEAAPPAPAAAPAAPAPVEINGSAEKWDGPQPSFLKRPTRARKPRAAKEAAPSED
ncbi:DUF4167 domain-containing protein [Taklimakanibacter albus]|uniref:DUF4167 domain-containing protein n=1 Tax=Taklimakanibacter albus TaxID=2800327 RepID=A0ACC5R664_9HYPH|nr:DUF4167 domain-containing protein [Aestuariivirga sp. YIM B02566]MBK1868134.1 DUF4167 domain-containing protein [Aestuariivirga sp. YIM B02566]